MTDTTTFIINLFVLLTAAVLAGELANRLGQVALVGQLLAGVLLGPTLLGPYIGLSRLGSELTAIQFLATVFILFMAGLDVLPEQIYRMGFPTAAMGVAVFVVPFVGISALAEVLMPRTGMMPLFLGLTLSITALPVMGIMLVEFGLLKTRMGNLLINTALVNELAAVSVFAVLLRLQSGFGGGAVAVAIAALSVGVFVGAMLSIHMFLKSMASAGWWESARSRLLASWRSKEAGFALLMIGMIGASLFSQFMGLTFVVGAFYAGIIVTQETAGVEAHRLVSGVFGAMTWGFFIPLFFAFVGIEMDLRQIAAPWEIAIFAMLLAAAVLTKVGTGYSMARFNGWSTVDSLALGNLVNSRGAVELAMAVILLQDGIFSSQLFTLVAAVGLVTTILAPIGASYAWRSQATGEKELQGRLERLRAERGASGRNDLYPPTLSFRILQESEGRAPEEAGAPPGGADRSGPPVPESPAPATPPPLPRRPRG